MNSHSVEEIIRAVTAICSEAHLEFDLVQSEDGRMIVVLKGKPAWDLLRSVSSKIMSVPGVERVTLDITS